MAAPRLDASCDSAPEIVVRVFAWRSIGARTLTGEWEYVITFISDNAESSGMRHLALVCCAAILGPAIADAAPLNWVFDGGSGDGSVIVTTVGSGHDLSIRIRGSDSGSGQTIETSYSAIFPDAGDGLKRWRVWGDWLYYTSDLGSEGEGPKFDWFGTIRNDERTILTDRSGEKGSYNSRYDYFEVQTFDYRIISGERFGWYVTAGDDVFSPGFAEVNMHIAPVPLPATAWLLVTALGWFGWMGFRQQASGIHAPQSPP